MIDLCKLVWCGLIGLFRSGASLQIEILALRHQLNMTPSLSCESETYRADRCRDPTPINTLQYNTLSHSLFAPVGLTRAFGGQG
jgi:hypothetical protein